MLWIFKKAKSDQGNILFYIILAVALFAALTQAMMSGGGDSVQANSSLRMGEGLITQAQGIRSALTECVLTYTRGDYPDTPAAPSHVSETECITDTVAATTTSMFKGSAARMMPQPVRPFTDWIYTKDGSGNIFIATSTPAAVAGDLAVIDALRNIEERFTADEVYIVADGTTASVRFCILITNPAEDCSDM